MNSTKSVLHTLCSFLCKRYGSQRATINIRKVDWMDWGHLVKYSKVARLN